jgi:hypothetical protein
MNQQPIVALRFYERWMLEFLARSPRIERLVVFQAVPEMPEPLTHPYIHQLERAYQAPPAGE